MISNACVAQTLPDGELGLWKLPHARLMRPVIPALRKPEADQDRNGLLTALPDGDWQRWRPQLERVDLIHNRVLHEPGETLRHVYFPTTAIVALMMQVENGATAEIALIGQEGMVGLPIFSGSDCTRSSAVVQTDGHAWRMSAQTLSDEFQREPAVRRALARYAETLITEIAQTAICNRHHSSEQQVSRLLLLGLDRCSQGELRLTHEMIAIMLGVRRESVTNAAARLQESGLIRYARGHITVLDRQGLEQRSCECYAVMKREFGHLHPGAGEG